jgi:hypothetical protein
VSEEEESRLEPLASALELARLTARWIHRPLHAEEVLAEAGVERREAELALDFWKPRLAASPLLLDRFLFALWGELSRLDAADRADAAFTEERSSPPKSVRRPPRE